MQKTTMITSFSHFSPLSCEWGSCLVQQEVLGEMRMDHNYGYLLFKNEGGPQKRFFHCRECKVRKSWNKSLKNHFSYDHCRQSPAYKQVLLQGPINNLFQNSLIHFEQLRSYQEEWSARPSRRRLHIQNILMESERCLNIVQVPSIVKNT